MKNTFRLSVLLLVTLSFQAVAEYREVQGQLEVVWADSFDTADTPPELRLYIKEPGIPAQRLLVAPEKLDRLGHLSNWGGARVSVVIHDTPENSGSVIEALHIKKIPDPATAFQLQSNDEGIPIFGSPESTARGEHLWLTIMCKFADFDDETRPPEYFQDMYGNETDGLQHYWNEVSYGNLRLSGEAASQWVTMPGSWSDYQNNGKFSTHELFDACTEAASGIVDYSRDYSGILLMFNGSIGAGGYGGGRMSSISGEERYWPAAWLSSSGLQRQSVVAHEIGHAIGLPHSDNGDGDTDPYDSPWDVMSSAYRYTAKTPERGNLGKHTVAYHKYQLGWLSDGKILQITEPGVYTAEIGAMAHPDHSGYRAIQIREYDSSDSYMLEARKRMGRYDSELPGNSVILSKIQRYRHIFAPSWVIDTDLPPADFGDNEGSMLRVGEVYEDALRMIRVSVDEETEAGFVVTVDSRWIPDTISCSDRDIILGTQQAVDSFRDTYGECDTILGDLVIGSEFGLETPDITDLSGLQGIRFVHGDLAVKYIVGAETLNGLESVERAERVVIWKNRDLVSLEGLEGLRETRELQVANNPALGTLNGLVRLEGTLDHLHILNNIRLTSLEGLERIEAVNQNFSMFKNEVLADCSALITLLDNVDDYAPGPGPSNMPNYPDIGGTVEIRDNATGCNTRNEISPMASPARLMTGSWYEPELSGAGFMIHAINENRAVAYYYGYDTRDKRYWMIGVHDGPIEWNNTARFAATQVSGGQFGNFDPADIVREDWGDMVFYLGHCDVALMSLEGQFSGEDDFIGYLMPLERLAATSGVACNDSIAPEPIDGVMGSWYDPDTSGQGFAVHKIDDDRGIVYFYGFDSAGDPLWLIGVWEGGIEFGQMKTITMQQASGGHFYAGFDPDDIVREDWGELNLRFDDCSNAWAHLSGIDGSQTLNLKLLAGSAGSVCQ